MSTAGIATGTVVNAASERFEGKKALQVLQGAKTLVVAKGKRVVTVDLGAERPDDESLLGLLLGPSGNLRAPTWTRGKVVMVGFHPEAYAERLR